jgi:predicted acetyltransferase
MRKMFKTKGSGGGLKAQRRLMSQMQSRQNSAGTPRRAKARSFLRAIASRVIVWAEGSSGPLQDNLCQA